MAIPTLDFRLFARGGDERQVFCTALVKTFADHGFCKISNHELTPPLIEEAFSWNQRFFALTHEQKMKAKHTSDGPIRGYSYVGQEDLSALNRADRKLSALVDLKECWDQMTSDDPTTQNPWPAESDIPGFRAFMESFFNSCHAVHTSLLQALCIGFGLPEDYLNNLLETKPHDLRFLHYPPVEQKILEQSGMTRAADHTDFGLITLLFQDSTGGLEVEDQYIERKFHPIVTEPGDMICNVGDVLSRWTNNHLRSTMHRVTMPPPQISGSEPVIVPGRRSIAFFGKPDVFASAGPLQPLLAADEMPLYPDITAGEYNQQRLTRIYA